jgi:hypothetical protein
LKTLIRNNSQAPATLPLPYTGTLSAGEGVVIDESANDVVAALFDNQKVNPLTNIFTVTQVSDGARPGNNTKTAAARKIGQALARSTADLEVNGVRIRRIAPPTVDTDAATKGYVDVTDLTLRALIDAIPKRYTGERYFELGDVSTGIWYVTVQANAGSVAQIDQLAAVKAASSVEGSLGTFAVNLSTPAGVAVQSITLFTYTKRETQPRIVLTMDNPQGAKHAHQFVRPSVLQFPPTNSPTDTVTVSVADAAGAVPTTYGVVGQLDPAATYPKIRIVATGFFSAESNSVSDRRFNKAQSLMVQF